MRRHKAFAIFEIAQPLIEYLHYRPECEYLYIVTSLMFGLHMHVYESAPGPSRSS